MTQKISRFHDITAGLVPSKHGAAALGLVDFSIFLDIKTKLHCIRGSVHESLALENKMTIESKMFWFKT